jgi:two-component system response regulator GlrR
LESAIQRAFVLSEAPVLDAASIDLPDSWSPRPREPAADSPLGIEDAVHQFERQYLADLLSGVEGNVTRAARIARKDRRTFQRLLRRHGIASQLAVPDNQCGIGAAAS